MKRSILVIGLMCLGVAMTVSGEDRPAPASPKAPSNAGFEKMKSLAGTWVLVNEKGEPTDEVVSVIRVTAAGSAVEETLFPGQPQEMLSVYTAEGPDVVMTHYCILGNQPRMKASGEAGSNQLTFHFAGGANLDPNTDCHMHGAVLRFIDADHLEIEGTGWVNGKPSKDSCGKMGLARKK